MKRFFITCLVLFVLVIFFAQTTVFAQTTGDVTVSGSVPESISITPPGSFCFNSLIPGNEVNSGPKTVTVSSNSSGWYLTVEESGGDGYMARSDLHTLTSPLQVKGGDVSFTSLISPVTLVSSSSATGTTNIDVYFYQVVSPDELPGDYLITLTFTVSMSPP